MTTVVHRLLDPGGSPIVGRNVTITLMLRQDVAPDSYALNQPDPFTGAPINRHVVSTSDGDGNLSWNLVPNDQIVPSGTYYEVFGLGSERTFLYVPSSSVSMELSEVTLTLVDIGGNLALVQGPRGRSGEDGNGAGVVMATPTALGGIQLAGDLGGDATAPVVVSGAHHYHAWGPVDIIPSLTYTVSPSDTGKRLRTDQPYGQYVISLPSDDVADIPVGSWVEFDNYNVGSSITVQNDGGDVKVWSPDNYGPKVSRGDAVVRATKLMANYWQLSGDLDIGDPYASYQPVNKGYADALGSPDSTAVDTIVRRSPGGSFGGARIYADSGPIDPNDLTRKDYVDQQVATRAAIAGDLGGTPDSPTVPGLAGKSNVGHTHPASDLTAIGTRDSTTFLRGDNVWAVPPGVSGSGVTRIAVITQADYSALTTPDPNTLYVISG